MITDDEIMRLFELADPARDDDGARMVDAAGYLDALQTRSYDMTIDQIPPRRRPSRLATTDGCWRRSSPPRSC